MSVSRFLDRYNDNDEEIDKPKEPAGTARSTKPSNSSARSTKPSYGSSSGYKTPNSQTPRAKPIQNNQNNTTHNNIKTTAKSEPKVELLKNSSGPGNAAMSRRGSIQSIGSLNSINSLSSLANSEYDISQQKKKEYYPADNYDVSVLVCKTLRKCLFFFLADASKGKANTK